MTEDEVGRSLEWLSYAARQIAIAGAETAMRAVIEDLLSLVDDDDERAIGMLSQDPRHAGSPALRIDALAQAAAKNGAEQKWEELRPTLADRARYVAYVGEEAGTQTQIIQPGTLVIRFDPLDGTTNAVNIINGFCSVATVDLIRDQRDRPRHLAGAIIGGEIDVSWSHWSRRSRQSSRYVRPIGQVFVRSVRTGRDWRKLDVAQEERNTSSVASVAASHKRFSAFARFRESIFAKDGVVYHLAGNPLCAALLLGHLGAVVETQNVTLHDSAFLIPHWILEGRIETIEFEPFDYLYEYEQNAVNFDPCSKPIGPFIAFVGDSNPFKEDAAIVLIRDPDPQGENRRQRFRSDDR